MTYKHEHYPKALYHATEGTKTVHTEAEHEALGDDWMESPADIKETKPEAKPKTKPEAK